MPLMKLQIVQTGNPVLRQVGRNLSAEEIKSPAIQELIGLMREAMREAPGVGLAAPQVGVAAQLAVIEDRPEYMKDLSPAELAERQRRPIDFHVIINPKLSISGDSAVEFFEGCLSVPGFVALVRRARKVRVECLNELAEPITIEAEGWYARILQHEIDHLNGKLYLDRADTRSFTTVENFSRFWQDLTSEEVRSELAPRGKLA
jgi:peptide deformylase